MKGNDEIRKIVFGTVLRHSSDFDILKQYERND